MTSASDDWRDRNQNIATWRGAEFVLISSSIAVGRRTAVWEMPYQDAPAFADLGASKRTYRVTGLLLGDDYMKRRDILLWTFEAPGLGELKHPRWGTRTVLLASSVTLTEKGNGTATFSAEFIEADDALYPIAEAGGRALVELGVEILDDAAATAAATVELEIPEWDTWIKTEYYLRRAHEIADEAVRKAGDWRDYAESKLSFEVALDGLFSNNLRDIYDNARTLFKHMLDYNPLRSWFDLAEHIAADWRSGDGDHRAAGQAALVWRMAAAVTMAEVMTAQQFPLAEDAEAAQAALVEVGETLLADDGHSPAERAAFKDLASAVWQFLWGKIQTLPRRRTIEVGPTTTTINVAFEHLGGAMAADSLPPQNPQRIAHPGFVTPGELIVAS